MRNLMMTFALMLLFIGLKAQQAEYYSFTFNESTPLRAKIFVKPMTNNGNCSDINADSILLFQVNRFANQIYSSNKKIKNSNVWTLKPLFSVIDNATEADVIVSGTYHLEKMTQTEEVLLHDKTSRIPYFELRTTNNVAFNIVLDYAYSDNTHKADTISIDLASETKPGKKIKTLHELELSCAQKFSSSFYDRFNFIDRSKYWYKLPKLKIKDKSLKEKLKNAKDLFKAGEIEELGKLYKRIYATEKSKEAAYCIGVCYELLGNYPKALEYYKIMPDFHTKVRMKKNMKLYDYLKKIDIHPTLAEF